MLAYAHKYFWLTYLLLPLLLGIAAGRLAAVATDIWLGKPLAESWQQPAEPPPPAVSLPLSAYEKILQRNIFDSRGPATGSLQAALNDPSETVARTVNLILLGTMVAGDRSLALLSVEQETALLKLDEEIPGGGRIQQIERRRVVIRWPDGSEQELLADGEPPPAAQPTNGNGQGVRATGANRWLISSAEIEKARANLNQLLTSARLEPKIVQGATQGFLVRMIRANSLLSQLGIQRGDLIKEVNGVSLDSPEKALQVFQQLREAKRVTVNLLRRGEPLTFTYEVD